MPGRLHRMPFGTEVMPDASVSFRLWAPAATGVELMIGEGPGRRALPMQSIEQGWFALHTMAARPGSLYRFRIDGNREVPDPASRCNPRDVQGPSMVIDPLGFDWHDSTWTGRPWHESIVYELHAGTFPAHGGFQGVARHLDHLVRLGVTAIELMPVAEFPGTRNWGYDGVLWFAPDTAYGSPEDLKQLVSAAHARGIMVLLDVVYNHFGPEGNYLHAYAPQFFNDRHHTPWGAAINYDGPGSRTVRDFVIHNALYWLEEFNCDGLRIDAAHAIRDDSSPDILDELSAAVRSGPGRDRHVHLVLENDANQARYLDSAAGGRFDAQWNDDEHHCLHVIATGEVDGYYSDYAATPSRLLQRCLGEGYAYQGERSAYRGGRPRGEPSGHLPPTAFVPFLQNHDQVGNRARGERLHHLVRDEATLHAVTALLLLAPSPPLLFMGEEWHAPEPFPYFCDFEHELTTKVREGRRREFARFAEFSDQDAGSAIPDPGSPDTFRAACLDWSRLAQAGHRAWLTRYRRLLRVRQREIVPRLAGTLPGTRGRGTDHSFAMDWQMGDRSTLHLVANLCGRASPLEVRPAGRLLYSTRPGVGAMLRRRTLDPWSVLWLLERA